MDRRRRRCPDADGLEVARRFDDVALAVLSRHRRAPSPHRDLTRLVRCCLLDFDPALVARNCGLLLAFLRELLSRALQEPSPSQLPLLEVFIENLLIHDRLRKCFALVDGAALAGVRVFTAAPQFCGELYIVPELVSCHFISSMCDERGFQVFVDSLAWSEKAALEAPEVGLPAALVLVRTVFLFSLPDVVQAHLVLLATRCVSARCSDDDWRGYSYADVDRHLLAFECAVNLYLRYLPALNVFEKTGGMKERPSCSPKKVPFSSCLREGTARKLGCQINGLLSFCQLRSGDDHMNDADILDSSVRFVEENQHVIHEQFRQEANVIVKSMVSSILGWAKLKVTRESDAQVSEQIICLAAALKLMSSSLLQILCYIRQIEIEDGKKKPNHLAFCKEYSFILETIRLIGHYEANELHQHDLLGMVGKPVDRGRASMLMLAHFVSLSIYCLRMRAGFLWKGCIIMIMTVMNLVIAEEESLGIFRSLIGVFESVNSPCDQENNSKGLVCRNSSKVIASQFKNIQKVHIQDEAKHAAGEVSRLDTRRSSKSTAKKHDGQNFFQCLPEYQRNPAELADLLDFVECQPGKDYSSWLKRKKKFRKWTAGKWIWHKKLSANKNGGPISKFKTSRR